jgi:hypothetical protein
MLLAGVTGGSFACSPLLRSATHDVLTAMTFGLVTLLLVVVIRRLSLRRSTAATVSAAVFVACSGVIVLQFSANASVGPLFRFTRIELADAAAANLRMLSDASWVGTEVGNYQVLAAIYRDGTGLLGQVPVDTMASMILGLRGVPLIAILLLQLIVLLRGALSRGRDSFFAPTAAACLVTICMRDLLRCELR